MAYSSSIQKLIDAFTRLPGIGPRQAARFAFHLLGGDQKEAAALAGAIEHLHERVGFCGKCYASIERTPDKKELLCGYCRDASRTPGVIMVVEKEADLNTIERMKKFNGRYHVLGGTIDPLDSTAPGRLHMKELFARIAALKKSETPVEVILATNATAEGDATALYLERVLKPLAITMTRLGRGLTTGTELEYSDEMTLLNALENRK